MGDMGVQDRRALLRRGAALGAAGAAAGLAGMAPGAAAQSDGGRLKEILDRGKLIVGTGSGNPPWHFEGEGGEPVGFEVDIARYLARGLFGLTGEQMADPAEVAKRLELVIQPADARIPNVVSGAVDICCQFLTVTPARALEVEFTIPYYREAVALLLPAGSAVDSAEALTGTGATIAVLGIAFSEELVRMGVADAELLKLGSVADVFAAVADGSADAAAVDLSTARYMAVQSPDRYKASTDSWWAMTFACAVAPGDQRWLNWVNTCLHELLVGVDFQLYQDTFQRAFGIEPPPPGAGFPVEFR